MTIFPLPQWFATAPAGRRWLAGVSGGADSVAMLHLLAGAGFHDLIVCHLHHGLRGPAADADADFVARLAESLSLPCEIGRVDVRQRMAGRGESLETAARHARHGFFAACAGKWNCPRVLLAHHADDQAETVLWNLLRGSHGLKGIQPIQEIVTESAAILEIHRPLLEIRRADLLAYLNSENLSWREDATNAEPIAVRNRLRHEALPLLSEISGRDAIAALCRAAADCRETAELEAWALTNSHTLDPQGRLHLPALRELPLPLQRLVLRDFLKSAGIVGIDRDLLDRALALIAPAAPPAINLPGGRQLRRRAGRLFVGK